MPTTILDGETLEQARARRFAEEAEVSKRMLLNAAAPDLLDALEILLEQYGDMFDNSNTQQVEAYYAARAAIAKARGQS